MNLITKTALAGVMAMGLTTAAQATTIYVDDVDVVLDNRFQFFDLNGDGARDFFLDDNVTSGTFGDAEGPSGPDSDPSSFYQFTDVLADVNGNAINVGANATIDGNAEANFGGVWSNISTLYDDSSMFSVLNAPGASGYFAIRMEQYGTFIDDGCGGCEFGQPPSDFLGTIYAFAEIERGSLIFKSAGYGNGFGVAAVTPGSTPAVPLPAGLPLMLTALGGFAYLRRRKAKA